MTTEKMLAALQAIKTKAEDAKACGVTQVSKAKLLIGECLQGALAINAALIRDAESRRLECTQLKARLNTLEARLNELEAR